MTTVLDIQRRLSSLGYNPGLLDGKNGRKARDAVKQFQRAHGLVEPKTRAAMFPPDEAKGSAAAAIIAKQPKATRRVDEIIVHCTATPEGVRRTIRSWHLASD